MSAAELLEDVPEERERSRYAIAVEPVIVRLVAGIRRKVPDRLVLADLKVGAEEGYYAWRQRLADVLERAEREIAALEEVPAELDECGTGVAAEGRCNACGHYWEIPLECGHALLCEHCRDLEIRRERGRVGKEFEHRSALAPKSVRHRMVTVTVPHRDELEERIDLIYKAKPIFLRALRSWCRESWLDWWLAFELTAGDDFKGHPHFHFLVLSEFLPWPVLAVEWARAVRSSGGRVLSAPLAEKLEWCRENCKRAQTFRDAVGLLWAAAEVPWSVPGLAPPRRRRHESATLYVRRRSRWARLVARWRGLEPRARSFARLESELSGVVERDALVSVARVPWLVVDVRHDPRKPVLELIKYTFKTEGKDAVRPWMAARAWAVLRRRHRFERNQWGELEDEKPKRTCPSCKSEDCQVSKRETEPYELEPRRELADRAEQLLRVRLAELARPPPRERPGLRLVVGFK